MNKQNPWLLTLQNTDGDEWLVEVLVSLPADRGNDSTYIIFTDAETDNNNETGTPVYAAILNSDTTISDIATDNDEIWNMLTDVLQSILEETHSALLDDDEDDE